MASRYQILQEIRAHIPDSDDEGRRLVDGLMEETPLAVVEGYFRPAKADPPWGDWKVGDGYSVGSIPVTVIIMERKEQP